MENGHVAWCGLYCGAFARAIGFVTWTDRSKCIVRIKETGIKAFTEEMEVKGQMLIRK